MENNAIRNGLFMGVASVALSLILYFIGPEQIFGPASYISFVIIIYFAYKAAADERADNDGFISFGEALKSSFLALVVGMLISSLFSYILIKYIDPSLVDAIREQAVASAEKISGMFGAGEDDLDKMRESIEEQDFSPTILGSLLNYIFMLIPAFILSLIIGAIVKRNNNNFA